MPEGSATIVRENAAIIVFGTNAWSEMWQTRQHVAHGLAERGWRVSYTSGPHFVWDIDQPRWRHAKWRHRCENHGRVIVSWPGRLSTRWPRLGFWDRRVVRRFVEALARDAGWAAAAHRITYVFHPMFEPYLDDLGDCMVIYHADDSFAKMGDWSELLAAQERALLARADLVIATSPGVRRGLPGNGAARAMLCPNGADVQAFAAGAAAPCPDDLDRIPRPRIGYLGIINRKIDFALVAALARLRPEHHWVFVGPVLEVTIATDPIIRAYREVRALENVHFLGAKPRAAMPAYAGHMDVNVICTRTDGDGWWMDISPLKLHECLASGRPVVASDIEAIRPFHDVAALARSVPEWDAAIAGALAGRGPGTAQSRLRTAEKYGWDTIIANLDAALLGALGARG